MNSFICQMSADVSKAGCQRSRVSAGTVLFDNLSAQNSSPSLEKHEHPAVLPIYFGLFPNAQEARNSALRASNNRASCAEIIQNMGKNNAGCSIVFSREGLLFWADRLSKRTVPADTRPR